MLSRRARSGSLEKGKAAADSFYDLRHIYASLLIQSGESLAYVKEQPGHSPIQVTVDVYRPFVSANRAAVDKLDAIPVRNPDATSDENALAA
jgi:integrase